LSLAERLALALVTLSRASTIQGQEIAAVTARGGNSLDVRTRSWSFVRRARWKPLVLFVMSIAEWDDACLSHLRSNRAPLMDIVTISNGGGVEHDAQNGEAIVQNWE
jgi:hypothetical protein